MSVSAMDVFSLRDSVVDEYSRFAKSFTAIRADDLREQLKRIYASDRYWPEPLLQINPNYRRGKTVAELVAACTLEPECAEIFRGNATPENPRREPLALHVHQQQAIDIASAGESCVVTTGTGSGKSLLLHPHRERGTPRPEARRGSADARDHHLSDERAREQPAGEDRHVDIVNEVTRGDEKTFVAVALVAIDWGAAGARSRVG